MSIGTRLRELGITLPAPAAALANYVPAVSAAGLLFLSGHLSRRDGSVVAGRLGVDIDVAGGHDLARLVAIDLLATAQQALGDLDGVRRVVRVVGMVNSGPGFTEQPAVIDGASDLLVEVFGERGRHARIALGVAQLPRGAALELEAILDAG